MNTELPSSSIVSEFVKPKAKLKIVFISLFLAIWIIGGALFWVHHKSSSGDKEPAPADGAKLEKMNKSYTQASLKNDLSGYIFSQKRLAEQYRDQRDYKNAERIMNEIFANVPAAKIDSSTYLIMTSIEKAKGDDKEYQHYVQLVQAARAREAASQNVTGTAQ